MNLNPGFWASCQINRGRSLNYTGVLSKWLCDEGILFPKDCQQRFL